MNGGPPDSTRLVITVSSSSRKAGKSTVASYLVRELGAEFGLKVSSGSHAPPGSLTSDEKTISTPGTDTGKLVEAGARQVLWVHPEQGRFEDDLNRALAIFPEEGLLVVEGNSAAAHIYADYAVFLMGVPFDEFKPSAMPALMRADLVLLDRSGAMGALKTAELEREIAGPAPGARIISYQDDAGREAALIETAQLIRDRLGL